MSANIRLIHSPHTSEKAAVLADNNKQFAFKVDKHATKPQIKAAIEEVFKVNVESINIVNAKSKSRRFGKVMGKTKAWKKAYITINPEQDIDFLNLADK